jgi:hypothetical protein
MTDDEKLAYLKTIDDGTDYPYDHEAQDARSELAFIPKSARFDEFVKDCSSGELFDNNLDGRGDGDFETIEAFFEGLLGWLTPEQLAEAVAALVRIGRARSVYYVTDKQSTDEQRQTERTI